MSDSFQPPQAWSSARAPFDRKAVWGVASRRRKVLIAGEQDSVRWCLRALRVDPVAPLALGGVLLTDVKATDAAPERIGRAPVLGNLDALENVVAVNIGRPFEVLLVCEPLGDRAARRILLQRATALGLDVWVAERVGDVAQPRRLTMEDVLGPGALRPDLSALEALISGKRVLVTGAGGSIGSQLCRRIAALSPAKLILLDNSEFNLFTIHHQIEADHPRLPLTFGLCDIRDELAVQQWFARERPQLVFHAAALKQLPIVECHPSEGVLTNVLGTRILARASVAAGAPMLLVSTDKAVAPSAVMGATKRLAELYCQALDNELARQRSPARVIAARLGNVLGSAGSVVQVFERQIAQGGPVTITDPEATRYFISIPQAANFLLTAAADSLSRTAPRGVVHVMDMGEPVSIVDLAGDMIRLAGYRPGTDVRISYVGLRDGEKRHEDLIAADEWVAERRDTVGVTLVASPARALRVLDAAIDNLVEAARQRKDDQVRTMLKALVAPLPVETDASLAG